MSDLDEKLRDEMVDLIALRDRLRRAWEPACFGSEPLMREMFIEAANRLTPAERDDLAEVCQLWQH